MDIAELRRLTAEAETHRQIVDDYTGQYTLGVSDFPPRFVLRVGGSDTSRFPRRVQLRGEVIPVEVTGDFAPVKPLGRGQ